MDTANSVAFHLYLVVVAAIVIRHLPSIRSRLENYEGVMVLVVLACAIFATTVWLIDLGLMINKNGIAYTLVVILISLLLKLSIPLSFGLGLLGIGYLRELQWAKYIIVTDSRFITVFKTFIFMGVGSIATVLITFLIIAIAHL